jgi:hypothetical protein
MNAGEGNRTTRAKPAKKNNNEGSATAVTPADQRTQISQEIGAGEGNRTLVVSLEVGSGHFLIQ